MPKELMPDDVFALPHELKVRLQTRLLATCGCTHLKSCNSCHIYGELKELERATRQHPTPAQAQGENVTVVRLDRVLYGRGLINTSTILKELSDIYPHGLIIKRTE